MRWCFTWLAVAACGRVGFEHATPDGAVGDAVPDGPLVTTAWTATTPLPSPRRLTCAVIAAGRAYVIGGTDGVTPRSDAMSAPVLADGMLGAWGAEPDVPGNPSVWHGCAYDEPTRTLYVVGGSFEDVTQVAVRRATVGADGHLAAWTVDRSLPAGRRGLGVAISDGILYAMGGESETGFVLENTVFAARIGAGGALDPWTTSPPLPQVNYMFGTASVDGAIYVTGGYETEGAVAMAMTGGSFAASTSLPSPRERHASVALGGYLYVLGGEPGFDEETLAGTLRAPILPDRSLGTWSAGDDLPLPLSYLSAAAFNGRIYVFGGLTREALPPETTGPQVYVRVPPP